MIDDKLIQTLVRKAKTVREYAYAPYSEFHVGAALLTGSGRIYEGCNVENVSFGATLCAERAAVASAVSAGERDFRAIAIAAGEKEILPCGICRQVLSEFSGKAGLLVICASQKSYKTYTLKELLPHAFNEFQSEEKEIEHQSSGRGPD